MAGHVRRMPYGLIAVMFPVYDIIVNMGETYA